MIAALNRGVVPAENMVIPHYHSATLSTADPKSAARAWTRTLLVAAATIVVGALAAGSAFAASGAGKRHRAHHRQHATPTRSGRCASAIRSHRARHAARTVKVPKGQRHQRLGQATQDCRRTKPRVHPRRAAGKATFAPAPRATSVLLGAAPPAEAFVVSRAQFPEVMTLPKVLGGAPVPGQLLRVTHGTWSNSPTSFAYKWQDCNPAGTSCENIPGTNAQTYTVRTSDAGRTLRVAVFASNAYGTAGARTPPTALVIAPESPALLVGSATIQPATDSDRAGSAEAFQYEAAAGGTVHSLTLFVGSGTTAPLIAVGLYGNVGGRPTKLLSGGAIVAPRSEAWNTVSISPVTVTAGGTYWLAALAPGGRLALRDVASGGAPARNSASTSLSELPASWTSGAAWANSPASFYAAGTSSETGGEEPPAKPANTTLPALKGSATEGETLTVSTGTWTGSPTSYAYQWQDCNATGGACTNIAGATNASYALVAADVGHTIRAAVTATNAGGSAVAVSSASAVVAAPIVEEEEEVPAVPVNTSPPTITGTAVEGQTLKAGTGTWTGGPTGYKYQWEDCDTAGEGCVSIAGATTASHKLAASDVGETLRVSVTATNAAGSAAATSPATEVVTAPVKEEEKEEVPAAPVNSSLPTISGSPVEGQTLKAGNGTWTGSPTGYRYQWEDCNANGEACTSISGATAASRKLAAADVGHAVRVAVTATNAGGSTTASSLATAVVTAPVKEEEKEASCTTTVAAGTSASTIASDIVGAANGSTVCLASGSYPSIHINGASHTSYVTVRPAPGATATVAGMEVANSSFLRFTGLHMSEGFNMRDTTGASHDYQFIENRFEEPLYGIVIYGNAKPIKKVLIEGNYMYDVHLEKPEVEGKCSAGYAQGQDVTIDYGEGVTIAHNTFKLAAWHYIQGGSQGPEGMTVEHNLFEGRVMMPCSHLNLWQIWTGGENDTFRYNLAIGEPGQQASTDGIIFENGAGSTECSVKMKNSVIEDNLFINGASAQPYELFTTEGLTVKNNTSVRSGYGFWVLTEHCGAGTNYNVSHNIDVESQQHPNGEPTVEDPDYVLGSFTGASLFDFNVSADETAAQAGSTHHVTNWTPKWVTTTWNRGTEPKPPSGYYVASGLPFAAGYEGNVGP